MKLIFFQYSFAAGGSQRHIVNLMNELSRQSYEIHLVTYGSNSERKKFFLEYVNEDVKIHNFSRKNEKVYLLLFYKIFSLCRRYDINLIYCNDWGCNLIGSVVGKLAGVPVITSQRNSHPPTYKYMKIYRHLCSAYCPNSQRAADIMINKFSIPPQKIHRIHQGLILENFSKDEEPAYPDLEPVVKTQVDSKFTFINVARVHPNKDQMVILSAIRLVPRELVEKFCVLIVGPFEDKAHYAKLKSYAAEHSINNVIFLGAKRNVKDYLNLADAFILSSQTEGFPNAVLEAMAMKLPVLTTDVGDVRELVKDGVNGFVSEIGNPQQLADNIVTMLSMTKPQLNIFSDNSRDIIREFSLENSVKKNIELFHQYVKK